MIPLINRPFIPKPSDEIKYLLSYLYSSEIYMFVEQLRKSEIVGIAQKKGSVLWTSLAKVHDADVYVPHVYNSVSIQVVFRVPFRMAWITIEGIDQLIYVSHVDCAVAVDVSHEAYHHFSVGESVISQVHFKRN